MEMMTSAYANKLIRKLNEDKDYWETKEATGCTYIASVDEEPVIPEYDYEEVSAKIEEIDRKVTAIRHAINLANATNMIEACGENYTVDSVLVMMAQLNRRKLTLDEMRKRQSKSRVEARSYAARKAVVEYEYINYDLEKVKADYEAIEEKIAKLQLALDKYNQTVEFAVEI
ncbi:MAG: hypothetical protein MJ123_10010 [Lachnospiraceae bacterium]|nr:hypothetical protein [Lachnospiraceae bacterium]